MKIDLQTMVEFEADYENFKKEIESFTGRSVDEWESFQSQVVDTIAHYESFFFELREKEKRAHLSRKAYDEFKKSLNLYRYSGGKNRLVNLRRSVKRLSEKADRKVGLPPVVRFADYLVLVEELYKQMDFYCRKTSSSPSLSSLFPDLLDLQEKMKTLIDTIKAYAGGDVRPIRELHNQIGGKLKTYVAWLSPQKNLFIQLRWIDGKKKLDPSLLSEIGSINVASRSDRSEGYYMRSQEVHKMHRGKGKTNPFAKRVGGFLAKGAHTYNIGGAKMEADRVLVQSELKQGRRKADSSKIKGLRDDILEHKNTWVAYMVGCFPACTHLKAPQAQVSARYPCVLILFEGDLMTQVNQSKENIPEFLTHFLAGHINAALISGKLRPLVERRQSFGFMTPTITDVHSGVRLSLGITPSKAWCKAVLQGIKAADSDIGAFSFRSLLESSVSSTEVVPVSKEVPDLEEMSDLEEMPVSIGTDESSKLGSAPEVLILNKFNRGSVLGAGHKLITTKLLSKAEMSSSSSNAKMSISPKELNALFGTRSGQEIVDEIRVLPKFVFEGQEVDGYAIALYTRLKSFYEHFLRRLHRPTDEEAVDWTKVDPAEILQVLMDQCVEATYEDVEDVVGLDESSDDEDVTSRVPSGMSALFLPMASYASRHPDRSIVYDTAPYSYFEIDISWNRTFGWDRIERRGVRYAFAPSVFRRKAEDILNALVKQAIQEEEDRCRWKIDDIRKVKEEKEDKVRERVRGSFKSEKAEKVYQQAVEEVEREVEELETQMKQAIAKRKAKKDEKIEELNECLETGKKKLKEKLSVIIPLLDRYLKGKKDDLAQSTTESLEELASAHMELIVFFEGVKGESSEPGPDGLVARSIREAFETCGFAMMDQGALAERESSVEIAFVDFNPCMTGEEQFDSGENLYHQTMKKYGKLRMIVVDITSATEEQIKKLVALFQDQTADRESQEIVPFLCMARSGTKHDQLGLDISTMGSCVYVMYHGFDDDKSMKQEFDALCRTSRKLSRNTEPALVKKLRRDLREAARQSEKKK